ncbi:MAG: hypothetical protein GXO55_06625 [Chloroflexi bacterium]|nr:hypothetical protein [Chloroflexota bacterium]
MKDASWVITLLFGVLTVGFVVGTIVPRRFPTRRALNVLTRVSLVSVGLGGLLGTWLGAEVLFFRSTPLRLSIWPTPSPAASQGQVVIPFLPLDFYADRLTGLFLLIVGFFTLILAVYSWGWLARDPRRHWVAGAFNFFVLALFLTLLVNGAFWLLLALELVTLASSYLMLYRSEGTRNERVQEAGRVAVRTYLVISHISIAFLLTAFLLLGLRAQTVAAQAPVFSFDTYRHFFRTGAQVPHTGMDSVIFLLLLLGLSIRAGMIPFHFWVPIAHPELPTNTHAMMSAIMLKIPVYLMIRLLLELFPPQAWWWGGILLLLAGGTALLTVFYALVSPDLKRALAYHSAENIGIIMAGLGFALLFQYQTKEGVMFGQLTQLALIAALYHTVNHATFKTLLFMGTGSFERRTGTVVFKELGGLLRLYPWTAVPFLVGALSIVGLPPFNGFVSEWLTLQTIFAGGQALRQVASPALLVLTVVTLLALGAAFALTAVAFVKIVSETLLGPPAAVRSRYRGSWAMHGTMVLLALLCVVLGMAPFLLLPALQRAIQGLTETPSPVHATSMTLMVRLSEQDGLAYHASISLIPTLLLVGTVMLVGGIVWRALARARVSDTVWAGGEPFVPRKMHYSGTAFSFLIWEVMARDPEHIKPDHPLPAYYRVTETRAVPELVNRWYNRLILLTLQTSEWVGNFVQGGDIRRYLIYIFATFLVVLLATLLLRQ